MNTRFLTLVVSCSLLACSPKPEDGDEGGSGGSSLLAGTGGSADGSGGFRASADDPQECSPTVCDGYAWGTWTITARCDDTGVTNPTTCEGAEFAWTVAQVSGEATLTEDGSATWNQQTTINWDADLPASCGSCDSLTARLGESWSFLTCSPGGSGCHCSGTQNDVLAWDGRYASMNTGLIIYSYDQPTYDNVLTVCAQPNVLTVDNVRTGRVILKAKE
jgi:hypothetical protein